MCKLGWMRATGATPRYNWPGSPLDTDEPRHLCPPSTCHGRYRDSRMLVNWPWKDSIFRTSRAWDAGRGPGKAGAGHVPEQNSSQAKEACI